MPDDSSQSVLDKKPAIKRSFFKSKPDTRPSAKHCNDDVFSRSTSLFDEIVAETQHKRRSRPVQHNGSPPATVHRSKKRRVSETSGKDLSSQEGKDGNSLGVLHISNTESVITPGSNFSLDEGSDKAIREANKIAEQTVIDLDSRDSPDGHSLSGHILGDKRSESTPYLLQKEVESSDTDAEFRELAAKARERRRLKERGQYQSTQNDETKSPLSPSSNQSAIPHDVDSTQDPVIEIFITSAISNTKPLIVQRRLSQRLKEVRLAWCERQQFSSDFTDVVFFTWRNRRLYDVTTCKNFQITGSRRKSHDSIHDGEEVTRVHLEAVTEEILATNKQNTESQKFLDAGKSNQGNGRDNEETKAQQLKVKVRAPGFEDHKLIVKPTTLISRLVNAFRTARAVPADKSITLMFDGDSLPPESTIKDHDIGDLDYIDAHIK